MLIETLGASDRTAGVGTHGNSLEPYALEWLAGTLEANGFEVKILAQLSDLDILYSATEFQPAIIGYGVWTHTLNRSLRLAGMVKAAMPSVIQVAGGNHPSLDLTTLESNFDFAVIGEGEATFLELCQKLTGKGQGPAWDTDGVAHFGEICTIAPRRCRADFNALPAPIRSQEFLARAKSWNLSYPNPELQTGVGQVSYSRGCPFSCSFCVSPLVWGKRMTYREATKVAAEIKMLRDEFKVNLLYWSDLTWNLEHDKIMEVCRAINAAGLHNSPEDSADHLSESVHWYALVKPGLTLEETRAMAKAGCSKVGIGIESFDEDGIREFGKPYKRSVLRESLEALDEAGIVTRALMVLGRPDETDQSVNRMIEQLKTLPIDQVRVQFLTPFPGTKTWDETERTDDDFDHYNGEYPVVKSRLSPDELLAARDRIVSEFYSSTEYADRCKSKLERFPHLKESYRWWFDDLAERGIVDLRWIAK